MRIGLDFGNVICGGGGEDTSFFGGNYLNTPRVAGFSTSLYDFGYDHTIHIISKCGEEVERRTMEWLLHWSFLPSEIIPAQNIHFVRKRHLKAPMAQALELDIFIDDRQDIIDSMQGIVAHPILFESWEQTNKRLEEIFNDNT